MTSQLAILTTMFLLHKLCHNHGTICALYYTVCDLEAGSREVDPIKDFLTPCWTVMPKLLAVQKTTKPNVWLINAPSASRTWVTDSEPLVVGLSWQILQVSECQTVQLCTVENRDFAFYIDHKKTTKPNVWLIIFFETWQSCKPWKEKSTLLQWQLKTNLHSRDECFQGITPCDCLLVLLRVDDVDFILQSPNVTHAQSFC